MPIETFYTGGRRRTGSRHPIPRTVPSLAAVASCLMLVPGVAAAQTVPLETIVVNGRSESSATPGSTPLTAVQPTSIVSAEFIAKNLPASGNYDEAIKFSPSVFDTAPNGPGLAESQNISIRGFQDGQFNVTFDGIPWGDSNDFTHHTTSYFMAHDLGQITVDRGPGTGATIGNATFGGTVYILSKAPDEKFSVNPYASYGSFNTYNLGTEVDTGALNASGTRLMIDGEVLRSDGYLTNEAQKRQNLYAKLVQPLGPDLNLTLVSMYNHIHQNISLGETANQIATLGPRFGLSTDPTNQNYAGYNADFIKTDFEYADLGGKLGNGWSIDAKLYTFAYFHTGLNGEDPGGEPGSDQYPYQVVLTPGGAAQAGVPGQRLTNNYRSIGTIVRVTKAIAFAEIQTGVWYDHQVNYRHLIEVDMSAGQAMNYDDGNTGAINGVDRDLHQVLQTLQPYLQVEVKPMPGLSLTPGVRYSWFDRNVDAAVNVKTGNAQAYDNTFKSWLPSFEARYDIAPNWAAYAQVAKGFLAPNENYFNRADPTSTDFKPETTWNYQGGTTFKGRNLTLALDAYLIDFSNLIVPIGSQGGQAIYGNLGGVHYRGVEGEGTFGLGSGFNLYANASLNSAKSTVDGTWVPNAPKATAAGGVIYDKAGIYVSALVKWIGPRFGDTGDSQYLSSFASADLSLGYDLSHVVAGLKGGKFKLNVNNVTNNRQIVNLAGYTFSGNTPLYWTNPGRSVFATVELKL
jgi:iron complex outermembrane receptor protein